MVKYTKQNGRLLHSVYGGTSIFVHESINFKEVDIQDQCKEKDLEICAIELNWVRRNIIIMTVYRSPTGDFNYFQNKLDRILNSLNKKKINELIICGDININYLEIGSRRQQLDNMLATYRLSNLVEFPTRIFNGSRSAIDNFFIDKTINNNIKAYINGLLDHE
jgi:exonuclease III